MRYAPRYISYAVEIISKYSGDQPFALFLKSFFAANKKFGSKDRKYIAQLCYHYYRLGATAKLLPHEEAIKTALFLCNDVVGEWIELFEADWLHKWSNQLSDRIQFMEEVFPVFKTVNIFPFHQQLSESVDPYLFSIAHLIQPDLFIRTRPGKEKKVIGALTNAAILFQQITNTAIALPNGTKLENILNIDEDMVVQDYSSQRVGEVLKTVDRRRLTRDAPFSLWDCCAASGGKSILAKDILGAIDITVSDIRASILHNLEQRFKRAGINHYNKFIADLSLNVNRHSSIVIRQSSSVNRHSSSVNRKTATYDLVLCDAPCTGSGTWGRTPEQLCFFEEKQIHLFQQLQQKIVRNIIPAIKDGGYFLYITCSVFEAENEAMVAFIQANSKLILIEQQLIKGYAEKADTMFVALFQLLA